MDIENRIIDMTDAEKLDRMKILKDEIFNLCLQKSVDYQTNIRNDDLMFEYELRILKACREFRNLFMSLPPDVQS